MPAALRQAMITTTQQNAPATYDFAGADDSRDSLHARNDAQGLRASVSGEGVRVEPATSSGDAPRWWTGLRLAKVGRGTELTRIEPANVPVATNNRASLAHEGDIEQWYVNGPLGIEQGFVLGLRPDAPATDEIVLEIELTGELDPALRPDGQSVALQTADGSRVARYSDLFAHDASGAALETWMTVQGRTIALHVQDRGAAYPVKIDPLVWVETNVLVPGEPEDGAAFGAAVAIDGDIAIVGAPHEDGTGTNQGAAYVFQRDYPTPGVWGQRKQLQAGPAADNDNFGMSVAISGDLAVVGASGKNMAGPGSGSAYVFDRNHGNTADSWGETEQLVPTDPPPQAGDNFGWAVAIAGNTVVVGARTEDGSGTNRGVAYVFDRDYPAANMWNQRAKLTAGDPNDNDLFGSAVAILHDSALNEDRVVVGAPGDDEVALNAGAAYEFDRSNPSANAWGQRRKLIPSGAGADSNFGDAVAMSVDLALVGAPGEIGDTGAAYVFERNLSGADQWGLRIKLTASPAQPDSSFGEAVAITESVALVGAGNDGHYAPGGGMVFFFQRDEPSANSWGQQNGQGAGDAETDAHYGGSVSMSGPYALVGAPGHDGALGTDRGQAYVLQPRLTTGEACADPSECITGFCVDGVCCGTACEGGTDDCQACSIAAGALSDGACGTRPSGSVCSDGLFCNGIESCTGDVCGGSPGDPCAANVGNANDNCSESCDEAAASCTAADPEGSKCDNDTRSCLGGVCIGNPGNECTDGAECQSTYCVDKVCCVESDCTPYRCGPAGACGVTCIMNLDCAPGYSCNVDKQCAPQAPAGSSEDQGGCSCRVRSRPVGRKTAVFAAAALLLVGSRRRRRHQRIAW
jgi:hypothetical protein